MPAYLHNYILTHLETVYLSYIKADETAKYSAEFLQKLSLKKRERRQLRWLSYI